MEAPRLPGRIESHLDFHREILDVACELLSLSLFLFELERYANGIPVCAVIVRDLYDTVQSSFSSPSD